MPKKFSFFFYNIAVETFRLFYKLRTVMFQLMMMMTTTTTTNTEELLWVRIRREEFISNRISSCSFLFSSSSSSRSLLHSPLSQSVSNQIGPLGLWLNLLSEIRVIMPAYSRSTTPSERGQVYCWKSSSCRNHAAFVQIPSLTSLSTKIYNLLPPYSFTLHPILYFLLSWPKNWQILARVEAHTGPLKWQ